MQDLKATFEKEKKELLENEKKNATDSKAMEQSLVEQIQVDTEVENSEKGSRAEKQGQLATKEKDLEETTLSQQATAAFLETLRTTCAEKKKSFQEVLDMRTSEIQAISKAIEIITGTVAAAPKTSMLGVRAEAFRPPQAETDLD